MENQSEQIPQEKAKTKKKSKIEKVYELHQKGVSVRDIAKKMKLSEQVIRSYVWRKKNPEKYKMLLARYFSKKKLKKENEAIKAALKEKRQAGAA